MYEKLYRVLTVLNRVLPGFIIVFQYKAFEKLWKAIAQ